ncbi:MAG: RDD family protein [Burkholderiaceae bacterium]|nr:RDD family protein [Burkholderiaceae bacterium]
MEHPDFSEYTHDQLRQVLTRIDRQRYPERVAEIERRLAQPQPAVADGVAAVAAEHPPAWAGFWRRTAAFAIDMTLLALVGAVLGTLFADALQALGGWGRLVGLGLALAYFVSLESRGGRGQTPGKALLDLAVRDVAGGRLRPAVVAGRTLVWAIPFFLNQAPLPLAPDNLLASAALSLLIFGLGATNGYLLMFDRPVRRSLADRFCGTVVIRLRADAHGRLPVMPPWWRGHRWIVAGIVLLSLSGPLVMMKLASVARLMGPLLAAQTRVQALPGVRHVGIVQSTSLGASRQSRVLSINLVMASPREPDPLVLARRAARVALQAYPDAQRLDMIAVTLASGYDIGLWSEWRSMTYQAAPAKWLATDAPPAVAGAR